MPDLCLRLGGGQDFARNSLDPLDRDGRDPGLLQLPVSADIPSFDTYFCYPSEMKNSAKLKVFRDFIVAKARNWNF